MSWRLALRPATRDDGEYLWRLHVVTLREYVAQTWGWDERHQRQMFWDTFDPQGRDIVLANGEPAGTIRVVCEERRLFLSDIRIHPDWQNRGLGTALITRVQRQAQSSCVPVELRVLRVNPAQRLYLRLGFHPYCETLERRYMRWVPQSREGQEMAKELDFGETSRVAVTILVDNHADLMARSTRSIRRFTKGPLLAEHGFAALVELRDQGQTILWDAGMTADTLMENARRMKLDLRRIDQIALSHGHGDHTAAMTSVLKAMDLQPRERKWDVDVPWAEIERYAVGRRVPLVAHPAAFRERWGLDEDGTRHGPGKPPPRAEWEAAGARIIEAEAPYRLAPGCWTTGQVPRTSFEHSGRPKRLAYRMGHELRMDDLEEDQAIVINIRNEGLVILSGCAHSGIVNTVSYARQISGVQTVHAILGGFHLARSDQQEVEQSIAAIRAWSPKLIAPTHCTGFAATARFAAEMPEAFVESLVGTRFLF